MWIFANYVFPILLLFTCVQSFKMRFPNCCCCHHRCCYCRHYHHKLINFAAVRKQHLLLYIIYMFISFKIHFKSHKFNERVLPLLPSLLCMAELAWSVVVVIAVAVLIYHHYTSSFVTWTRSERAHTPRVCKFLQLIYYGLHTHTHTHIVSNINLKKKCKKNNNNDNHIAM